MFKQRELVVGKGTYLLAECGQPCRVVRIPFGVERVRGDLSPAARPASRQTLLPQPENQSRLPALRRMDAPEHYRQRTEIARRMATEMTDEDLRERMEMVAEEYDQTAINSGALRRSQGDWSKESSLR